MIKKEKKNNSNIIVIKDFVERKIRIKYIKCAKSAVRQKCLQLSFENVQRDVSGDRSSVDKLFQTTGPLTAKLIFP